MVRMKVGLASVVLVVGFLAQLGLSQVTPRFRDVTATMGFQTYEELDLRKLDNKYWGSTIADINRDGVYDLWLGAHGNNPELYVSNAAGKYDYFDPKLRNRDLHATAAADVDNDGYLDLFINLGGSNGNSVNGFPLVHLSSRGEYEFNRDNGRAIGLDDVPFRGRSSSFLDVNGDGCLDLLYVNRRNESATYSHLVYENLCNGRFRLRNDTGIEQVNMGWHQIVDVNNDSLPDILFLWYTGVQLWIGTGDFTFVDGTDLIPRAQNINNVRTAAEIDYDNDGDMDLLFVRARPGGFIDDVLLENTGTGFVDVSAASGVAMGEQHYHVTTGDLNNDGYTDYYISRARYGQARIDDMVMLNNGDKTFSPASSRTGLEIAVAEPQTDGDNANIFDYNNDGRADVLVGSRNSAWKLYENVTPMQNRHYVLVRVGVPRAQVGWPKWFTLKALGALVKVFCGDQIMMARVGSPGQSHSQSYMDTLHFGLGTCDSIQKIEVHYMHDVVVTRMGVSVDKMVLIGSYFPCPRGRLGRTCELQMQSCNTVDCPAGESCEVAELVRSRCDEQRCGSQPPDPIEPPGDELLVDGGFERSDTWELAGFAKYTTLWQFEGTSCMRLRLNYAAAKQFVELEANTAYVLTCKVLSGPVRYKVFKDGVRIEHDFEDPKIAVPGRPWDEKSMTFRALQGGTHQIVLDTISTESGSVDDCSLKAVASGGTGRMLESATSDHLEEAHLRQSGCQGDCLKVYCPI